MPNRLFFMNKLVRLFGDKILSRRLQIFLCDLLQSQGIPTEYKELQLDDAQEFLLDYLYNKNPTLIQITNISYCNFVDEFYFQWINKKNHRQLNFVIDKIQKKNLIAKKFSASVVGIDAVYLLIDTLNSIGSKIEIIKSIEAEWNNHISKDKVFKWFRDEGNSRIEFAWDWLCKKKPAMTENEKPFECYTDMLFFFDRKIENYIEREFYIEAIKRNWRQHIYRNKPSSKKQCNILLSENTIKILDGLCDYYRQTKQELIEILILSENENRVHLKKIEPLPMYNQEAKPLKTRK